MNEKYLSDTFESLIFWAGKIPITPILLFISFIGLVVGIFFAIKPVLAIEIQRRFYAKINWKIEPISMPKEIRNTRIMGGFLIVLAIVTLVYILMGGAKWIGE